MGRLSSKRCVITGAGSGLGRAGARIFAREGAAVACLDIDAAAAEAVAAEITAAGGRASAHRCDVTDDASVARCIAEAVAAHGGIDACWANAGTGDGGNVVSTSLEHWNRILDINLTGMFRTAKHVVPHMIEAGGGSLIFTSSSGVLAGTPGVVSNMAAKGGVLGLTRQIAADYLRQNIRANAVCPGPIRTHALISAMEERDDAAGQPRGTLIDTMTRNHPRGRLGEAEDVANVALFLASDESAWVNAQFINVSGTGH